MYEEYRVGYAPGGVEGPFVARIQGDASPRVIWEAYLKEGSSASDYIDDATGRPLGAVTRLPFDLGGGAPLGDIG